MERGSKGEMKRSSRLTLGERALLDRLEVEAKEVARAKRLLGVHRRARNQLIKKARAAGFTMREIEKFAGISNSAVSQIEGKR